MFALGLRYLNGWSMAAADGAKKQRAEWPPHPDRVFMALAAAWFETGGMSTESMDDEYRREGEALRWLETLPPPAIAASDATMRTTVVSFVPVNDAQIGSKLPTDGGLDRLKGAGLTVLPEHRSRQPRSFPVAIPHESAVHLIWREAELGVYRSGLERLAAKVTHVGHSASFAQVWVEDGADIIAAWEPIEGMAAHPCVFPLSAAWADSFAPATGPSGSATTIFVARLNGPNSTHRR
jgi:CRISPR-associated protein Csb2